MTVASQTTSCPKCRAPLAVDARFCGTCGTALAPTEPTSHAVVAATGAVPDMVGREIAGRYRVLAKLGEGGMGAVYRAEQISLKRKVALKVLKPELSADPGLVRRFNAEAELAGQLNHPNTVTLYDHGQCSDGSLFIAMEFIEGISLRTVVHREAPLDPLRVLHIVDQVCSSLGDAHAHGIVHRDLKPDNIMLIERGRSKDIVRVLDFGIAKLRDEQGDVTQMPMTRAGDLLGTPQYMAPEQIRGEKVDPRTDVYALGAMLYEMATGRLPFEAPTLMAILSKHLTEMPVRPVQRRADLLIPPELDELIMEALQKSPDSRPRSMEVMAERIAAIRRSLNATGPAPAPSAPAPGPAPASATPIPATQLRPASVPGNYPAPSVASPPPGVPRRHTTPDPTGAGATPYPTQPAPTPAHMAPPGPPPMTPAPSYGQPSPPYGATPAPGAAYPPPFAAPPPFATPQPGGSSPPGMAPGYVPAMPTPGPMAYPHMAPPAARRSRAPLWIAIGVLVAGGIGAGVYAATRSREVASTSDTTTPTEPGEVVVDNSGNTPGDNSGQAPGPVSPDFSTRGRRDFYGEGGTKSAGDAPAPDGETFNHPVGFQLIVPPGFSDASSNGLNTWIGTVDGNAITITLVGMDSNGVPVTSADYQAVGTSMAQSSGGTLIDQGSSFFAGSERPTGIVDMGGRRAQYVVYHHGQLFIVLTVMVPPEAFASTEVFRTELFDRRIRLPAAGAN